MEKDYSIADEANGKVACSRCGCVWLTHQEASKYTYELLALGTRMRQSGPVTFNLFTCIKCNNKMTLVGTSMTTRKEIKDLYFEFSKVLMEINENEADKL